tara:strand:- start:5920 stop:6336 length:417 start_codon:yes stop_codon:yes gene_type:complete
MSWQDGLKKKQTKFGFQRTLGGESIANLDPIEEAVRQKEKADKSLSERKKREAERLAVANRKGQEKLKKEITDTDLRIDRFEELIEQIQIMIDLINERERDPDNSYRVKIAEAYNTLLGSFNEVREDMFQFKIELDLE